MLYKTYVFLWVLNSFNGILYKPSGFIARVSLLLILLFSIYHFFIIFNSYKTKYVKGLNLLVLLFTIYGTIFIFDPAVITSESGDAMIHYVYLKQIYISLLPFYSFFYFAKKGCLDKNSLMRVLPLFIGIVIIKFFHRQYMAESAGHFDASTNNTGYLFVSLLPFIFLLEKKKIIQYLTWVLLLLFTFMSVKRGAVLIALLFSGWFFLATVQFKNRRRNNLAIVGIVLMIVSLYVIFTLFVANNEYFAFRLDKTISEDREEVREVMYTFMLDWYLHQNTFIGFLFGHGPYTSVKILGLLAHNDWLEIALAQGLIGILVYLHYWKSLFINAKLLKKDGFALSYNIAISFLIIYFTKSFFSMSYDVVPFMTSMILAYAIALPYNNKELCK